MLRLENSPSYKGSDKLEISGYVGEDKRNTAMVLQCYLDSWLKWTASRKRNVSSSNDKKLCLLEKAI